MKINGTNQQIPVEVQWDSIVQLLKTVDFLKTAVGSVRLLVLCGFFALRQPALVAVRHRAFWYLIERRTI